ncbi:MAG: GGDEF domain-containing protein, partial [Congregibacter sp.]|nr:GGDEF domain-containing protein [Congregibacter sp.]
SDPYFNFVISTVLICALLAVANVMLAARSISSGAATAFAIGFAATGTTWLLTAFFPQNKPEPDLVLLLVNSIGAIGMSALWSGFSLRAGFGVNWWFMSTLASLWIVPVLGILMLDFPVGSHVPLSTASITIGAVFSTWRIYRKRGRKNAGDWALIAWMTAALPIAVLGILIGTTSSNDDPNAAWIFYLKFLPIIFAGIGLFTLVSVALDALTEADLLARTDGLTGILNRRAFDSELSIAVARSERYQRDLSLIIVDLDKFKRLNDKHGHPTGDAVIRTVARIMEDTARRIDVITRIGGEEFALILPDTPASAALQLAERLREAITNAGMDSIEITASFGVASTQDTDRNAAALFKSADEALYTAKAAGRNCVRYSPDANVPSDATIAQPG